MTKYSAIITLIIDDKATEHILVGTHHPTNAKILAEIAAYSHMSPVTGFKSGKYVIGESKSFVSVGTYTEVTPQQYKALLRHMEPTVISKRQIDIWWDFKSQFS